MKAKIKDVKVVMSRIGVTTLNTPKRNVSYVPMITVTFDDPKIQKSDCMVGDLWGKFKKAIISDVSFARHSSCWYSSRSGQ